MVMSHVNGGIPITQFCDENEMNQEQEEEELRQSTECCLLVEGVAPLHACMRVSVGAEHYAAVDSPSAAALCRPAPPWMLLQVMLTHDTPLPSRSSP